MPESPLQAAGAQIQPSASAPLHTNEWFTGMLTNGNPLGPGAVPYLYQKFYSASRYDRLIGGLNTEITARATVGRRPGHTVVNASPGSAAKRMYMFQGFNASGQNNRLLADLGTTVADVTGTGTSPLFTKSSGAGRACFQGVGNTCYIGDGIDLEKYMQPGQSWQANTVFQQGALIIDTNGNVQVAETFATLAITGVQIIEHSGSYYAVVTFQNGINWTIGTSITFAGLQAYTALNGVTAATVTAASVSFNANANQAIIPVSAASIYGPATDVGTGSSQPSATQGQSGASAPSWATGLHAFTADGNIFWQNYGAPVYPWSPTPLSTAPTMVAGGLPNNSDIRFWQPNLFIHNSGGSNLYFSILDPNNNVQLQIVPAGSQILTGVTEPPWSQQAPPPGNNDFTGLTNDGSAQWLNCGVIEGWTSGFTYNGFQCIRDSNGNLQYPGGVSGTTGASQPTWNTTAGGTTADGSITWINIGPGIVLLTGTRSYFAAYHTISGQVTTVSPSVALNPSGAVLGPAGATLATLSAPRGTNADIDQIWIFATAQGGSLPLLLGIIPNPTSGSWSFSDNFPDSFLNSETVGPQNHANDPPAAGFVPAAFHLGLVCGFVGTTLFYSNGTTTIGNPNESFPPANNFQLPSLPVAAWSTALGLIVLRVDGISVMLGTNTSSNPLYVVNIFDGVGLASRDGYSTRGNSLFMVTTTGKVVRFTTSQFISAIQGVESGVSQVLPDDEIGFPIGDLLTQFTPANCYVAWYEGPSNDSGLFVCDGSGSWYMMRVMTLPDEATPWSPKATIATGISSIYACETAPGITSLLIATPAGPIWKRDTTIYLDAGMSYSANAIVSPIVLSQPGSTATVRFITTEEVKISGASPLTVSVLFDELSGTFINLTHVTNDPPNLAKSKTIEIQRFQTQQGAGTIPVCRYLLEEISWAAQNYANELLTNTIYGTLPEKARR
jgi:hypothetical protein